MALDALGVDALGVNCSLGPKEIAPILQAMRTCTNLPLILKPNAGLPDPETGAYHTAPDEFARDCAALTDVGAAYIGGCCGTTPAFIEALGRALESRRGGMKKPCGESVRRAKSVRSDRAFA